MDVSFPYGDSALTVRLPDHRTTVVQPREVPGGQGKELLHQALLTPVTGPPLREIIRPGDRVAVAVCDGTRPQPRQAMLETLLADLGDLAAQVEVTVLVATGSHRGNTSSELLAMFGPDLMERLTIVNHDARDPAALIWCGTHGRRVPVWLNRRWVEADVRITTGFVEPHFFAGFSGGPKLVAPGLAGIDTILTLHDYERIASPKATWGITEGNPIHDDVRAVAAATCVDFAFDVVLNGRQEIIGAFAGRLFEMHAAACAMARDVAMAPVSRLFDVVVTSNSGFPLDQNLYQAVKGMSAAAQIVKPGGLIVSVSECRDGFPDHGSYRSLLTSAESMSAVLDSIAKAPAVTPDQWQVQVQARIQARAQVVMYSDYLNDGDLAAAHLSSTGDVAKTVAGAGRSATVCALPGGPQTIPYLAEP